MRRNRHWPETNGSAGYPTEGGSSHGLDPSVLVGVAVILIVAKIGGELFERIGLPAVLGELAGGIIVGSLLLLGFNAAERTTH